MILDNVNNNFFPKRLSTVTAVGTTRYNTKKLIEFNPSIKSMDLRSKPVGMLSPAAAVSDNQFPKIDSFIKHVT